MKEELKESIKTNTSEILSIPVDIIEVSSSVLLGVVIMGCRAAKVGIRKAVDVGVDGADSGVSMLGGVATAGIGKVKGVFSKKEKPLTTVPVTGDWGVNVDTDSYHPMGV